MSSVNLPKGMGLDLEALQEGRWFELESAPGVRVKLRPEDSREFARRRMEIMTDLGIVGDEEGPEFQRRIHEAEGELYADTLLVDWDGPFQDEDGNDLEYTPERGASFLNDDRYTPTRREIIRITRTTKRFQERKEVEVEERVGNSSGGSSSTESS